MKGDQISPHLHPKGCSSHLWDATSEQTNRYAQYSGRRRGNAKGFSGPSPPTSRLSTRPFARPGNHVPRHPPQRLNQSPHQGRRAEFGCGPYNRDPRKEPRWSRSCSCSGPQRRWPGRRSTRPSTPAMLPSSTTVPDWFREPVSVHVIEFWATRNPAVGTGLSALSGLQDRHRDRGMTVERSTDKAPEVVAECPDRARLGASPCVARWPRIPTGFVPR
jgi:hypothetical protein